MKIIRKSDAIHTIREEDNLDVLYHLFDDYEIHIATQQPGTRQPWHYHEVIAETFVVLDGELTLEWKEDDEIKSEVVTAGDVIESETTSHSMVNNSDAPARLLTVKRMKTDENYRDIFKSDKVLD